MKIIIPFNEWSRERLKTGQKTMTSRRKRYGEPGDIFIVDNVEYTLIEQRRLLLKTVYDKFWKQEGACSQEEFLTIWKMIHRKVGYQPDLLIWLHIFKPTKEGWIE